VFRLSFLNCDSDFAMERTPEMRGVVFASMSHFCEANEISLTKNDVACKYLQGGYVYRIEASSTDGK